MKCILNYIFIYITQYILVLNVNTNTHNTDFPCLSLVGVSVISGLGRGGSSYENLFPGRTETQDLNG